MWFRFRNQILAMLAVVALGGIGFAAWQLAAPDTEQATPAPPSAPASTAPEVEETDEQPTTPASTVPDPSTGEPSYLDLDPAEVAAVNEMLQRAAVMEDLETITGSVDDPTYMLGVFEQFRDIGGADFPDAEIIIGAPRPGTMAECAEALCAALDITISVPSLAYSNTLPIIAQRTGDTWALTRVSLCAIASLAGVECPPTDVSTTE